eukprot:276618_1
MGSEQSSETNTRQTEVTEQQELNRSSKTASSFGEPYDRFTQNFQDLADQDLIPGLKAKKTYQVYTWASNAFGHHSIVIGCSSRNDVGYVTMELRVDEEKELIWPDSQFISRDRGDEYIKNKKWTMEIEVENTMNNLMELATNLIKNHGKYSSIVNSCHAFVNDFLAKCGAWYDYERDVVKRTVAVVGLTGGASTGAIYGSLSGFYGGGPFGAAAGGLVGLVTGMVGGLVVTHTAQGIHKPDAKHDVKLQKQ